VRKIPAWVGTTDDAKVPLQVQLRILVKQGARCAITGHKFAPGDAKRLDHIVPLADGGLHGEKNLQWIIDVEHKAKTKAEAEARAWVRSVAAKHAGLNRPKRRWGSAKPEKAPLQIAAGAPEIMRRFG
jgi:5-methylcytosine-specific restriction enzyme A